MMKKSELVRDIFQYCDSQNILSCLARPQLDDDKGDIDLLVESKNVKKILEYLKRKNNFILYSNYRRPDGVTVYFYCEQSNFKIDFITECSLKGISFIGMNEILHRRQERDDLYHMDDIDQALLLLMIHVIKHKGLTKNIYHHFIQSIYYKNKDAFSYVLVNSFNEKTILDILEYIESNYSFLKVPSFARRYILHAFSKNPLQTFIDLCVYFVQRIHLSFFSPTVIIVFYGVDGSGKTTLINNLKEKMSEVFTTIRHYHFMPSLPWKDDIDSDLILSDPHAKAMRNGFLSLIKIIYLVSRYWLGNLRPKKGSTLYIYDRYYYDMIADPLRYRMSLSRNVINFFGIFVSKPDMSFLIDVTPEVAYKRKQEVEISEIKRQTSKYRQLMTGFDNHVIINGELPEKITCQIALSHFINTMKNERKDVL